MTEIAPSDTLWGQILNGVLKMVLAILTAVFNPLGLIGTLFPGASS
jgi:hypothetical protein